MVAATVVAVSVALDALTSADQSLILSADAGLVLAALAPVARRRPRPADAALVSVAATSELVEPHELQLAAAQDLVDRHGEDSLAPFIVRPDKAFAFAAGGVLAYRVVGRTAVVSGDPVGPPGCAPAVLARFLQDARARHWNVAVYGASATHIDAYADLGLRALCVGEEAVARPHQFTLEGRSVRKLRQSVHRIERRGWEIVACDGIEIDAGTEAEIGQLETAWRGARTRLIGFAMGMGAFEGVVRPSDLYLLARAPDGQLCATMRFIAHRGKLSLDTMRRIGETPNGLNEALVCRALELARTRGIPEVSLNYAGLAHLVRRPVSGSRLKRNFSRALLALLSRRFQMERLVRFNEKFSPEWRPRYLVYQSRHGLPRAVLRTLQAEGYVRGPRTSEPHEDGRRVGAAVTV